MRILDFITHPPYQYDLCKTGHEFHFVPSEMWRSWDERLRPLPQNATVLDRLPRTDGYDVVITATREQFQRVEAFPCPKVFLSHTRLHPWDEGFFARLPDKVEVVYVSEHKRRTFGGLGRRGQTIPLAVDPAVFVGYTGEHPAVLSVTNSYAQQGDRGYGLFQEATHGLPSQVVGHGNERIAGAFAAESLDHLRRLYRIHRCYLHTDPQERLHLATLEAMATGVPLVAVPIADLVGLLVPGTHALIGDTVAELRPLLQMLLGDAALAHRIGWAGQQLVLKHFGITEFLRNWDRVLVGVAASG